jgi:2-keto-4-pentenoate hydratase/2-oxohepta-3-ene-1,7-dioic acid hydratase in catechol pathway
MRLIRFRQAGTVRLGAVIGDPHGGQDVVDIHGTRAVLSRRSGLRGGLIERDGPGEMAELLADGRSGLDEVRDLAAWASGLGVADRKTLADEGVLAELGRLHVLPPVSPVSTIYCLGLNYESHAAEARSTLPAYPEVFIRNYRSLSGHRQAIVRPTVSTQLDWQGELAVVVGKPAHRVDPDRALDYVAGYTCFNDGSVRDYQKHGPFPAPGKNFAYAGSAGPWLVTSDAVPDPQALSITTRINDEVVQSDHTSQMHFTVARIVSYLSEFTILQPGDLIATGTPGGVGVCLKPQRFLVPGETLTVDVESVGTLQNDVVDENALDSIFELGP